jgi:hypothetical protein
MKRYVEDVAVDPLALLLPTSVYLKFVEKDHPREPARVAVEQAMRGLNAEEKAVVVARARLIGEYAKLAEETALAAA